MQYRSHHVLKGLLIAFLVPDCVNEGRASNRKIEENIPFLNAMEYGYLVSNS